MGTLDDLPASTEIALDDIKASFDDRLIGIPKGERRQRSQRGILNCRRYYDAFAQHALDAGIDLDDDLLDEGIPKRVADAAFDSVTPWVFIPEIAPSQEAPPRRRVIYSQYIQPERWAAQRRVKSARRSTPEREHFGNHKLTQYQRSVFRKILEPRIQHWKRVRRKPSTGLSPTAAVVRGADAETGDPSESRSAETRQDTSRSKRRRRPQSLQETEQIILKLQAEGASHLEICRRLGNRNRPCMVGWRDLRWDEAYFHDRYGSSVRTWLSKTLKRLKS